MRLCIFLLLLTATPAFSRQRLYLINGYSLDVENFRTEEGRIIATVGTGEMQFQASEIVRVEPLPNEPRIVTIFNAAGTTAPSSTADLLSKAALGQGISEAFVRSVAIVESGLRSNIVSNKGAVGIMQLMPGTAKSLKVNSADTAANILGGAIYLRQLLLKYNGDSGLALAAYNAGPGAVSKYRGVPPYRETRAYILRVLAEYQRQLKTPAPAAASVAH